MHVRGILPSIAKALRAIHQREQITIVEGHDGSSYFWIMPVRIALAHEESEEGLFCRYEEEISIEEMDVSDYLSVAYHSLAVSSSTCNKVR